MAGYRTGLLPVVVAILSLFPIQTLAAELGKLEVLSEAGEPFEATVQIGGVESSQVETLTAGLAQRDAFRAARLVFDPKLSVLDFEIQPTDDPSSPILKLTSQQPMNAGFLDALIELKWAGGQVVREYTFVIPAASLEGSESTAVENRPAPQLPFSVPSQPILPEQTQATAATTQVQPEPEPQLEPESEPVVAPEVQPETVNNQGSTAQDPFQVRRGQTLSEIALRLVDDDVSLNQAMAAIYEKNQKAFFGKSVHNLRADATLVLPNKTAILSRNRNDALLVLANNDDRNVYSDYARRIGLFGRVPSQQPGQEPANNVAAGNIEQKQSQPAENAEMVDQLRIGSGGQNSNQNQGEAINDLMAEELVAKTKALQEANERIALLEQNINDLQQLLKMQEASRQVPIEPGGPPDQFESTESTASDVLPEIEVENNPVPEQPVQKTAVPVLEENKEEEPEIAKPIPAGSDDWSWADFFTSPWMFGLMGILAVLALVLVLSKYRNKEQDDANEPWQNQENEENSVESFDEALAVATEKASSKQPVKKPEPVKPPVVSEVDQEIEIEEVKSEPPQVKAKEPSVPIEPEPLPETESEAVSAEEPEPELDSKVPDLEPESESAAEQGTSLDSDVELDFPADNKEEQDNTNEAFLDELESMDQATEDAQKELKSIKQEQADQADLEEIEPAEDSSSVEEPEPKSTQAEPDQEAEEAQTKEAKAEKEPETDEENIELQIPEGNDPDEAVWQEVATKLDLASAYVEIGDADGAKELLNEIINKGDGEQVKKAKALLNTLE